MFECSRPLGDVVKRARGRFNLTQMEIANSIHVDSRTVLNIENYKGNPKLEVLYLLVRILRIDANEIFYPEINRNSPGLRQLRLMIEDCSESEAEALIPIFKSVLSVLRSTEATIIK